MAQPLEALIKSALRPSSRLKDVEAVISDAEASAIETEKRHANEVARSIDPDLTTAEAREARNAAADLEHDLRRLNASLELLRARRQAILQDEQYAARKLRYEQAKATRDALAGDIRTRYPAIVREIITLVQRISASDAEIDAANRDLPRGAEPLLGAEHLARGFDRSTYWPDNAGPVIRLSRMRLPFPNCQGDALPKPESIAGGLPRWQVCADALFAEEPADKAAA